MSEPAAKPDPYTGLRQPEPTLRSASYWDARHYDQDLAAVWYRSWVLACRSKDIAAPLEYRTLSLGTQEILILRDETGVLRAFHNTCRHRGSQLCRQENGRLKARLITCPYHAWSYSLRGDLVRVPSRVLPDGFQKSDYPLYSVALAEWRGLVFVNLSANPSPIDTAFDEASGDLS